MNYEAAADISTHRTEMLILAILHISAWGCLIRSDYNFVFLFFSYFYLISKKDKISITIIFGLVIMLMVMDIIFFIFIPQSWMTQQQNNSVWNNLQSMHGFAVFIAIIVFILKIPLLYLMFTLRKSFSKA